MNKCLVKRIRKISAIILVCWASSSNAATETESFTVSLSNLNRAAVLEIENSFVQISVYGEERNDMEFTIVESDSSDLPDSLVVPFGTNNIISQSDQDSPSVGGLTRLDRNPGFIVEELNNIVSFKTGFSNLGYHVIVKVPTETSVKLRTINNYGMRIEGVNGEHELANINGDISAKDISGSIVAETANGTITANLVTVSVDTPMAFSSMNGDIDISFPANYKANARIDSRKGEVYTDFDFEPDQSPVEEERQLGSLRSRLVVSREIRGSINGGGPSLQIKTFSGSVYIRKIP